MPTLLLRRVRVASRLLDVLVDNSRVAAIGCGLWADVLTVDGRCGALVPGLHDHHIHLLATASADASIRCGPPDVLTLGALALRIAGAAGAGWIRGIGYEESVAGPLGRRELDSLTERPLRIQHRGGSLWYLNTSALDALGLTATHPDGRLWRQDDLLRERLGARLPDLTALGARLAGFGITGVTDATPGDASGLAKACKAIPQRVLTMGTDLGGTLPHGPAKVIVGDHALPALDDLVASIANTHAAGRAVAIHSVTRESLLLIVVAFEAAGVNAGDRVEHASVAPPEAIAALARLDLTVVTQPTLIARHGTTYLNEVDARDVPDLWPFRSLLRAHVRVACSSDAPYGDLDPWASVRAARDRLSSDGRVVGAAERVDAGTALSSYFADPQDPGGSPRRIEVGAQADLVLLDTDETGMIEDPVAEHVRLTVIGGRIAYQRKGHG